MEKIGKEKKEEEKWLGRIRTLDLLITRRRVLDRCAKATVHVNLILIYFEGV